MIFSSMRSLHTDMGINSEWHLKTQKSVTIHSLLIIESNYAIAHVVYTNLMNIKHENLNWMMENWNKKKIACFRFCGSLYLFCLLFLIFVDVFLSLRSNKNYKWTVNYASFSYRFFGSNPKKLTQRRKGKKKLWYSVISSYLDRCEGKHAHVEL